jgi:geranylgeranyl pyrophosphate synthase
LESLNDIMGDPVGDLRARSVLAARGKRLRPFLAVGVCEAILGVVPDAFKKVAVSVECFHKASLIHDDIEDGDLVRDGAPTVHAGFGIPEAINIGDTLIHESYRLLSECDVLPVVKNRMFECAIRGQLDMCHGQFLDLTSSSEIQMTMGLKTSSAFIVALQLGALYAAAVESTIEDLVQFGKYFGVMFQLLDDEKDGNPHYCDMFQSYRTYALESRGDISNDRLKVFLWDAVQAVVPNNPRQPVVVPHLLPTTLC